MSQRNLYLSGLLLVQLVLAAFLLWPRSATVAASPLIADLKMEDVNKVVISEASKSIQVAKSGDKWVLPDRDNFEVLAPNVTDLISKVVQINTGRLVATNSANFGQLKVADNDFNKKLELSTAAGKTYTLLVGTSPNNRATNVRMAGANEVYITDKLNGSDIRTDYAAYVNTQYYASDADRMMSLSFTNANGTLSASKDVSGTWQLADIQAGEAFSNTTFATLAGKLVNLSFLEPVGKTAKPEYGFDAPQAVITITVRPGADVTDTNAAPDVTTLTVGAKDDASAYYVKSSKSDYYVKMNTFNVDDFINKKRQDYISAAVFAPLVSGDSFTNTLSSPITGTTELTTTPPVSATGEVTASGAVTATEAVTTTEGVTTTAVVTP